MPGTKEYDHRCCSIVFPFFISFHGKFATRWAVTLRAAIKCEIQIFLFLPHIFWSIYCSINNEIGSGNLKFYSFPCSIQLHYCFLPSYLVTFVLSINPREANALITKFVIRTLCGVCHQQFKGRFRVGFFMLLIL